MLPYRIEPLSSTHGVERFDCGQPALNRFLVRHAWMNQRANASRTYVALMGEEVVGFHTLVVGHIAPRDTPERIQKGLARHPVPLMILARLAVTRGLQGKGIGAGLLKDAILRTLAAADIAGIRALAVHAKDDLAKSFYEHFGFTPSPTDPMHLFVLIKDLRAMAGEQQ
jgi:GNAT superfamily N-acetyltransferase